ncbi:MAG: hypothetical protein AAF892_01235 [Cyanobacteria bacterium P01_D01_bin.71]
MNDQILTEQLAKTGNLLDLLNDEAGLQAVDAADDASEADWDGPIEAGLGLKAYVEQLETVPPEAYRRQRWTVRLLSILLPELKTWLQSWGLGLSLEAVSIEAQRRVYEHLKQLTSEQQTWMDALLAEDDQKLPMAERRVRSQTVAILSTLFTQDDWQALADVAGQGMVQGVLQVAQQETMPPVAV